MGQQLTRSVAASLRFVLVDATDFKTPETGYIHSTLTAKYQKRGQTSLTTFTLSAGNTRHLGEGIYEIDFTAAELDTLGSFCSTLKANDSGALADYREDQVVIAGTIGAVGYVQTLHTQDGGAITIPGATIQVRDSGNTTVLAQGAGDAGGNLAVLLPAGTYKVHVWKPGYTFAGTPFTLVVTADATTNYTGAAFAPVNPGAPATVLVYGYVVDVQGAPVVGATIDFEPFIADTEVPRPYTVDSVSKLLSRYRARATTDALGYFQLSLIPNGDIRPSTPVSTKYRITLARAESADVTDHGAVTITSPGPLNLEDLIV